jgi:hypothetical protein
MTRTSRAAFPRALVKDRSESKSGHRDDKNVRKGGAGAHGWGSLADEKALEDAALNDEQLEFYEANTSGPDGESTHLAGLPVIYECARNREIWCVGEVCLQQFHFRGGTGERQGVQEERTQGRR